MKAFKKSKVARTTTSRKEYNIITRGLDDPYWDECWGVHYKGEGWSKQPNKQLYNYQVRLYKSWKHNRKTQYKEK